MIGIVIIAIAICLTALGWRHMARSERLSLKATEADHHLQMMAVHTAHSEATRAYHAEATRLSGLVSQLTAAHEKAEAERKSWQLTCETALRQWERRTETVEGKISRMGPGLGGR